MSDILSKSKEMWLTWWIVIAWVFLFTLVSLGTAITSVLYGMRWREIDGQDKFIALVLIFIQWGTVMMAFLNKAASRVQRGELPITEEDKTLLSTKTVVTAQVSAKENP